MSELDGDVAEGVALVFVDVGSANAAALHVDEYFVIIDFRNRELVHFNLLDPCQGRYLRRFWNCHHSITSSSNLFMTL